MRENTTPQPKGGEEGARCYSMVAEVTREILRVGLVDGRGRVVADGAHGMPDCSPREAIGLLAEMILSLASSRERGQAQVTALGVAVEGQVEPATGRVTIGPRDLRDASGRRGWSRVDLVRLLGDRLTQSGYDISQPAGIKRGRSARRSPSPLPIRTFPLPLCSVAGEVWVGRARGKQDLVYLSIGEEVTAGIWSGGRPLHGSRGLAGRVGWLSLREGLRAEYQRIGCLTAETGKASYSRRCLEEWDGQSPSILGQLLTGRPPGDDSNGVEVGQIFQAARGGDPLARQVIDQACQWIGRAVSSLLVTLDPAIILLGGEIGPLLKPYHEQIHTEAERWIPSEMNRGWRLASPQLGIDASLVGAAHLLSLEPIPTLV
jgi:predicted NBD/HSP70 family sugar kinase